MRDILKKLIVGYLRLGDFVWYKLAYHVLKSCHYSVFLDEYNPAMDELVNRQFIVTERGGYYHIVDAPDRNIEDVITLPLEKEKRWNLKEEHE
jgi:hypothetical protein